MPTVSLAQSSELDNIVLVQHIAKVSDNRGLEPFTWVVLSCIGLFALTGWFLAGWMSRRLNVRNTYDLNQDYRWSTQLGGRLEDPPAKQAQTFGALLGAAFGFFGVRYGWSAIQTIPHIVLPGLAVGVVLGWFFGCKLTRAAQAIFAFAYGGKLTPEEKEKSNSHVFRILGSAIGALVFFFGSGLIYRLIMK